MSGWSNDRQGYRQNGQPELRIGDDEREAAVTALGEHYAAGRLSKEEYDERADLAWAARTRSALLPLFADLPRPQAAGTPSSTGPTGRRPDRGHPGWWAGAWMAPLFLVLVVLVVLTHLPVFLMLVLGWVIFARMGRHWSRSRGYGHRHWDRHWDRGTTPRDWRH